MHPADKKLNEMNRLSDMAHFPAIVNAGATCNILITLSVTWLLLQHYPTVARLPYALPLWIVAVLIANLLPVIVLRLISGDNTPYSTLRNMDFFRDQHRFSDWVYLAASANMAFWIILGWTLFLTFPAPGTLYATLAVAALATFAPVLLRKKT